MSKKEQVISLGNESSEGFEKFTDGRIYEGEFKNHKMHGQGTYTFPDVKKNVDELKPTRRTPRGNSLPLLQDCTKVNSRMEISMVKGL